MNSEQNFLKHFGISLIKPLLLIFNKTQSTGQVPSQPKMTNTSAIFKRKGDNQDLTNNRPTFFATLKILEKKIFKYLSN